MPDDDPPLTDDERVADMLLIWEEHYDRGEDIPAEVLCRAHPHLLKRVQEGIRALKSTRWTYLPDPPFSTPLAGRYRLDRLIGEGRFSHVWKAFDLALQRRVAVKLPKGIHTSNSQRAGAFLGEARKIARLEYPGIVPVYDVGREHGVYFIVYSFITGTNLQHRLQRKQFGVRSAVQLVAKVARYLHHAHENGAIHGDVKPANILLDHNNNVFITDFGIPASVDEPQFQSQHEQMGMLVYMAPEQLNPAGAPITLRADIYSLGVVLYEMLTTRIPFEGQTFDQLQNRVLHEQPLSPRSLNSEIPWGIDRICLKCLAKAPADRYSSAKALADDLGRNVPSPIPSMRINYERRCVDPYRRIHDNGENHPCHAADDDASLADEYLNHGLTMQYADGKQAIEAFSDAIRLSPDCPAAFFHRAGVYLRLEDHHRAIEDYSQVITLAPNVADAYVCRAKVYKRLSEWTKAIDDYSDAIRLDCSPAGYCERADLYAKAGNHAKAIEDYSEAIRLSPDLMAPYLNRARLWLMQKQYTKAVADYSDAIRLRPNDPEILLSRALAHVRHRDYGKAIEDYSETIRLRPGFPSPYYGRGFAYECLRDEVRAIEDYTEAIRYGPEWADLYISRGRVLSRCREYKKAIDDFSAVIHLDATCAEAYFNRAVAYTGLGERAKAAQDYSEAVSLNPMVASHIGAGCSTLLD